MTDKNIESTNEYLDRMLEKPAKSNKKGVVGRVIAIVVAGLLLVGAFLGIRSCVKKRKNDTTNTKDKTSQTAVETKTNTIDDLGKDLGFKLEEPTTSPIIGDVVSQDPDVEIDPEKIVVDKEVVEEVVTDENGNETVVTTETPVYYIDEEAKDKAEDIGKTVIDDKEGTLVVDENGTVKEKTEGYEVKDENGNTVVTGNDNGDIPGYVEDPVIGGLVKEEEAGKYAKADTDYYGYTEYYDYDAEGRVYLVKEYFVLIAKGDIVLKETLEKAKLELSTVKGETTRTLIQDVIYVDKTEETTVPEETATPEETTIVEEPTEEPKENSYYTIGEGEDALTFESKADYEQWLLQGCEGYSLLDGIMVSDEKIQELMSEYQKAR